MNQIGINNINNHYSGNTTITIGVIDTGIDRSSLSFKNEILDGTNILEPGSAPYDDNGHGTAISGIINEICNENKITQNKIAKIMPIKVLDSNAKGKDSDIALGIHYAVDHKANIIVLSLGLIYDSAAISESINYADTQNVLVVAAVGNGSGAINYPAAYPTVLAVGGVDQNNKVNSSSNRGQEIDLVAPWKIYTTLKGGGVGYMEGTSMAAPQVAAAAALLLSIHPELKTTDSIINTIRNTTEDIDKVGWDENSGYGLLRIDHLLDYANSVDFQELNNSLDSSKMIPINKWVYWNIENEKTPYYFHIRLLQKGILHYQSKNITVPINMKICDSNKNCSKLQPNLYVSSGDYFFQVTSTLPQSASFLLSLTNEKDFFEPDDQLEAAQLIFPISQKISGTFDKANDNDWYKMEIHSPSKLTISLSTNTSRIDPVIEIQKNKKEPIIIDEGGGGDSENTIISVDTGTYYFKVTNAFGSNPIGFYILDFKFDQDQISNLNYNNSNVATSWFSKQEKKDFVQPNSNYVYGPVRFIAEQTGYNVTWIPTSRTIILNKVAQSIVLKINSNTVQINGSVYQLSENTVITNGISAVPIDFFSNVLNIEMKCTNQYSNIIFIENVI
jgi:hypothetical protein